MSWTEFAKQLLNANSQDKHDERTDSGVLLEHTSDPDISLSEDEKSMAWQQIRQLTLEKKGSQLFNWSAAWKVAASIVVIIGLRYWFWPGYRTLETQVAQTSETTLMDGSRVLLNQESSLSYGKDFNQSARSVKLRGEAFFNVQRDELKPFIVDAGEIEVTVLGTSFNVYSKSDSDLMEVIVESGKVVVQAGTQSLVLLPGEAGFYNKSDQTLTKSQANPNHLAWRTHQLTFESSSFQEVKNTLERIFDVQILLDNEKLNACEITSIFKFRDLSEVMEILQLTIGFEYIRSEGSIKILSDGC